MFKFQLDEIHIFTTPGAARTHQEAWNRFVAFANGKTTFEVWCTLPTSLMFLGCPEFYRIDIIHLLRTNPGIIEAEHVESLSRLVKGYHLSISGFIARFSLSDILERPLVPNASDRIGQLLRQEAPFRIVEDQWVHRFWNVYFDIYHLSSEELMKEALRLGYWPSVKEAQEELLNIRQETSDHATDLQFTPGA